MRRLIFRFASCEAGATAIEYGLIATVVAVGLITVIGQVGTSVKDMLTSVKTGFDSAQ